MMWNMGELLDAVAEAVAPNAEAFIHGDRVVLWPEAKRRMDSVAAALRAEGLGAGDKVAFYMRNRPEYSELAGACFLGGFTHVNINYRYRADEVAYILADSDAVVVVFDAEFAPVVEAIRHRLPKMRVMIQVGGDALGPSLLSYEDLATQVAGPRNWSLSPEDEVFIYTGGTTGMPKGVMYRHEDLGAYLLASSGLFVEAPPRTPADVARLIAGGGGGLRYLPACPQMHGTGLFVTLWTMLTGGCVVTLESRTFDADLLWRTVERRRVTNVAIVGDAFAKPLLRSLDDTPEGYDLQSLQSIGSSGAMWSAEVKAGLLLHLPRILLLDVFASTETNGMGMSISSSESGVAHTAKFTAGGAAIVIDEDDRPLPLGSGVPGRLAVGGLQPTGYYKDAAKTAKTFKVIDGIRYSIPGDFAVMNSDGSVTILGRGSHCINTAGEKVFPEEVEETLKTHADVEDALVMGRPDDKWGQVVTGVVRLTPGAAFDEPALRQHVRDRLADYKTPKRIVVAAGSLRAPNGKADYAAAAALLDQGPIVA